MESFLFMISEASLCCFDSGLLASDIVASKLVVGRNYVYRLVPESELVLTT